MASPRFAHLVLDIGGVLLSYSTAGSHTLPPRTIKTILDSTIWHEYERGRLSQQQCYDKVAAAFEPSLEVWEEAVSQLRLTLKPNVEFIAAVKEIKIRYPGLKIYAFTNISAPDFDHIQPEIKQWEIFDHVFTSATLGCRKPELNAYTTVLELAGATARTSIFVDDRPENVLTAHSLGFQGILFDDTARVVSQLHNLLGSPITRGMEFLSQRAGQLFCETDQGVTIKDNFSQLLILQCTGDRNLVTLENKGPTWQFFIGDRAFTDSTYPDDTDTTSLALVILNFPNDQKQMAMDMILDNLTTDGLPMVYFDKLRPRFCPYVCANVLRFFYLNGQGCKLDATLQYLCRILETQAYEIGSRYYLQPEWMIYYIGDLCGKCKDPRLGELRQIVTRQLKRRIGTNKDVMSVALRLLAAQALGVENFPDLQTLINAQQLDGGWETVWMFTYGNVAVRIGSRGVVTAMAVKAIRASQKGESV